LARAKFRARGEGAFEPTISDVLLVGPDLSPYGQKMEIEEPSWKLAVCPNPLVPPGEVVFHVPRLCKVSLKVYDMLGREVRTLVEKRMPSGVHRVEWDGRDNVGRQIAGGVYILSLETSGGRVVGKVVVLR